MRHPVFADQGGESAFRVLTGIPDACITLESIGQRGRGVVSRFIVIPMMGPFIHASFYRELLTGLRPFPRGALGFFAKGSL